MHVLDSTELYTHKKMFKYWPIITGMFQYLGHGVYILMKKTTYNQWWMQHNTIAYYKCGVDSLRKLTVQHVSSNSKIQLQVILEIVKLVYSMYMTAFLITAEGGTA